MDLTEKVNEKIKEMIGRGKFKSNLVKALLEIRIVDPFELPSDVHPYFFAQSANAYHEDSKRRFQESAVEGLKHSLSSRPCVEDLELDTKKISLFNGTIEDAILISVRDRGVYDNTIPRITLEEYNPKCCIASFSESKTEPVGFYLTLNYKEDDPYLGINHSEQQRKIGEAALIYVTPEFRGKGLGKLLTSKCALSVIEQESIEVLRFISAHQRMDSILKGLGFSTTEKTRYGENDYQINLQDRQSVREIFQRYLNCWLKNEPS